MSKIIVAVVGSKLIEGYFAKEAGKDAAEATAEGTELSVAAQQSALDYQKEVEAMPRYYRDQAMQMLGSEFGLFAPPSAGPGQSPQAPGPASPLSLVPQVTTGIGVYADGQTFGQRRSMADFSGFQGQPDQRVNLGPPPPEFIPNPDYTEPTPHRGRAPRIGSMAGGGPKEIPNPAYAEYQQAAELASVTQAGVTQPGVGQPGTAGAEPQMSIFERAVNHPLYKQLYEGIEDTRIEISTDRLLKRAEESVMRRANVSGGFRSGGMQRQLLETGADIDERLQLHRQSEDARIKQEQNAILVDAYNRQISGLSGFAGTPSNSENIAQSLRGIGTTQAQGAIAQGNIAQQTNQAIGGAVTSGIDTLVDAKIAGLI